MDWKEELKARIFSRRGHLSNPDSAAFAAHLCETGTHALMLAHLSQENNRPEIAYEACLASVGSDRVRISVAQPDEVTEMPRCFSISIQSETACREDFLPFTAPASLIAPP